jgi:S1-C subfamily serine protease
MLYRRKIVSQKVQLQDDIKRHLLTLLDEASENQPIIPAYVGRVLYDRAAFLEAKHLKDVKEVQAVESQPDRKSWWLRGYFKRRDSEHTQPASDADRARCVRQIKPFLLELVGSEKAKVLVSPEASTYSAFGRVYASITSVDQDCFEITSNLDGDSPLTFVVDVSRLTLEALKESRATAVTLHQLKVLYKELGLLCISADTADVTNLERVSRESSVKIHTRDGQGSGVIVFDLNVGLHVVVTNRHVVEGDAIVMVETHDGKSLNGYVVAQSNDGHDLAAVIVDSAGCKYPPVGFGETPEVGDSVLFGGYPTTFSKSDMVLVGGSHFNIATVIETNKPLSQEIMREGYTRATRSADWNSGGSGGGVFNFNGQLIGLSGACVPYEDVGVQADEHDTDPYGIDLFIESELVQQFLFNQVLKLVE